MLEAWAEIKGLRLILKAKKEGQKALLTIPINPQFSLTDLVKGGFLGDTRLGAGGGWRGGESTSDWRGKVEGTCIHLDRVAGYFNDGASRPDEGFSERHAIGAVVGLFGGRAEYMKWQRYYEILADPNRNSLWCYPLSVSGR